MSRGIYRRLAWTGICKNKKLYLPYILACMGMVMMCYIVSFLGTSVTFGTIPGGTTMQQLLGIGFFVMCVFSLIFLFYTHSFLIRRRKKELGLYNILGMGKKNIALVLLWESAIIVLLTLAGGLFLGILLSKFAELGMVRLLGETAAFTFSIETSSISRTALLFLAIFALIYLNTLRQIHVTNPIALLHSENLGEKPPKGNWFTALLGAVLLATAYYLAVTIQDPVAALAWFFVAVVMVIVATYLLFISGSVKLCRFLQKRKNYYYKTNHFVSVSSMAYRMKRNGAGLASICILCTMVLVMVSSTVCLYIGVEDSLRTQYPRDIQLDVIIRNQDDPIRQDLEGEIAARVQASAAAYDQQPEETLWYYTAAFVGMVRGNRVDPADSGIDISSVSDARQVYVFSLEDYNRMAGAQETLAPDEVLLYTTEETYHQGSIQLGDGRTYTIKKQLEQFTNKSDDSMGVVSLDIVPLLYVVVPDLEEAVEPLASVLSGEEAGTALLHFYYGFNLDCEDSVLQEVNSDLTVRLFELQDQLSENEFQFLTDCIAGAREDFYGLYGGLFFLGILLGIVFIFAAVLIIYYKQVSEGYEDQARFDIMQKVGMTKKEIRKSINSQILTVFFLPLLMAGVHLAFAFPLIRKLLLLFGLVNGELLMIVTLCCYLVFALFYVLVYRATSRAYFSIVSGMRE